MGDPPERSVEERLTAVEAAVSRLQRAVDALTSAGMARGPDRPPLSGSSGATFTRSPTSSRRQQADREAPPRSPAFPAYAGTAGGAPRILAGLLRRGPQFWISRVGIALLLAGVAYLFKYAVDQGWLTPTIRVAFGLVLGAALAGIGFRVRRSERWFTPVMLGGAAATWYITGFAAFQVLHLVSFPVAFAFMVLVTVFTFAAGVGQDEPGLAVLAALGGLGTPFFLYTDTGSVPGLMAYTSLVLVGTSAIYFAKGWRSLLWTTAVGGWLVVALGFRTEAFTDRIALQGGITVIWLLFALVPVVRALRGRAVPATEPTPEGPYRKEVDPRRQDLAVLVLGMPVIALFTSRAVWTVGDTLWGALALAAAGVYAVGARYVRGQQGRVLLSAVHAVTAAVLLAIASALLFEDHVVFMLWGIEATVLHLLVRQWALDDADPAERPAIALDVTAHILYAVVGIWMLNRLVELGPPERAMWNVQALADMAVIAVTLVAATAIQPTAARWYRLAAHAAILGWLAREFSPLPVGDGIVTATWGLYALALLVFVRPARNVALGTLFLAAGKLVVHDLSQVEPIWRILLFLGFGGVFLAVSYYFTDLWNASSRQSVSDKQ
jgi:uncharacterized membrane protein